MADETIERVWLAAQKVGDAAEAAALLAELSEKNPLLARIKDTPNTHLAVIDLTSLDRPSQHKGPTKFQLSSNGIDRAMATLISKPVHVTAGYDGHFERGKKPKPIGVFLGGITVDREDGSKTVRAILSLWDEDFPEEVAAIQANKDILGASYEITFNPTTSARLIQPGLVEIAEWEFSGGAILQKAKAGHPETQVLVADDNDKPKPPAEPAAAQHTKGSGGRALKGGQWMKKFAGIPEEHHAAVDQLIADAVAKLKAEGDNERQAEELKAEKARADKATADALQAKKDHETAMAAAAQAKADVDAALKAEQEKSAGLEAKVTEVSGELETVKAEAATLKAEKAEAELNQKIEAAYAKLAAQHSFDPADQKLRAQKLPIVKKVVAGEHVSFEEMDVLAAGGSKKAPAPAAPVVPLRAGGGEVQTTKLSQDEIKKLCPTLGKLTAASA